MAASFDAERLELAGQPVPVGELPATDWGSGAAQYAVSRTSCLAYLPSSDTVESTLVWVDRAGKSQPVTPHRRAYISHRISPDGKRMAAVVWNGARRELWIYGLDRETSTPLTGNGQPLGGSLAWTSDGTRLVYAATIADETRLLWRATDGSGPEEPLIPSPTSQLSGDGGSLSPDGSWLAFVQRHPKTGYDIWRLRIDGDRKPQPFLVTPDRQRQPVISPDGEIISYVSLESGSPQVYVSVSRARTSYPSLHGVVSSQRRRQGFTRTDSPFYCLVCRWKGAILFLRRQGRGRRDPDSPGAPSGKSQGALRAERPLGQPRCRPRRSLRDDAKT